MDKKYNPIDENYRLESEQALVKKINDDFKVEQTEPEFNKYVVHLQGFTFTTSLTDDELAKSASLTFGIVEELKNLNNEGIDRECTDKLKAEIMKSGSEPDYFTILQVWTTYSNDRLKELLAEADRIYGVDGAYALLIANPMLINVICAVYERLVDNFDDEDVYAQCTYFLMRGIMRLHREEIE